MFNRCINNKVETNKTNKETTSTSSRFLILVNLVKKTETKSIEMTIITCPNSNPKLNDSKGNATFSSLPNIDFNKYEKPIPWINPKTNANV